MSEQNTNSLFKEQDKQEVNIKDLLIHYLLHWQWMAISIFSVGVKLACPSPLISF